MVLDGGRVVQRGTHVELIEHEGIYREAYLAQKDAAENPNRGSQTGEVHDVQA